MIGLSSLEVTMIATKHKDLLGESLVTGGSEKVGVVMHRWLWVVQAVQRNLGLLCTDGYGWFRGSWGCYEQIRCQWVNVWKFHAIKLKCLH